MENYQKVWSDLMDMVKVMKEFDLEEETLGLILSIEHLHSELESKLEKVEI